MLGKAKGSVDGGGEMVEQSPGSDAAVVEVKTFNNVI
jgi:hypothetical protein